MGLGVPSRERGDASKAVHDSSSSTIFFINMAWVGWPGTTWPAGLGQAVTHPIVTATGAMAMCSAIQDDVTTLARVGSNGRTDSSAAGLGWMQQQDNGWSNAVSGQRST